MSNTHDETTAKRTVRLEAYSSLSSDEWPTITLYDNVYSVIGRSLTEIESEIAYRIARRGAREHWNAKDTATQITTVLNTPRRERATAPKAKSDKKQSKNIVNPSAEGMPHKLRGLPADYVKELVRMDRGPRNNYNGMLANLKATIGPKMDDAQWTTFLNSGLGPKEWMMLSNFHKRYQNIVKHAEFPNDVLDASTLDKLSILAGCVQYLGLRWFPPYLTSQMFSINRQLRKVEPRLPTWPKLLAHYFRHIEKIGSRPATIELLAYCKDFLGANLGAYPSKWKRRRLTTDAADDVSFTRIERAMQEDTKMWRRAMEIKEERARENFSIASAGAKHVPEIEDPTLARPIVELDSLPVPYELDTNAEDSDDDQSDYVIEVPGGLEHSDQLNPKRAKISKGGRSAAKDVSRSVKQNDLIQASLARTSAEKAAEDDVKRQEIQAAKELLINEGETLPSQDQPLYEHLSGKTFSVEGLGTVKVLEAGDFSDRKIRFFNGEKNKRFKTKCGILVELMRADVLDNQCTKVFVSDIHIANAQAKVWSTLTWEAKISALRSGSELVFPVFCEDDVSIDPKDVVAVLDIMFGAQDEGPIDTLPFEMIDSDFVCDVSATPPQLKFKDVKYFNQTRAYTVAIGQLQDASLFPINQENIIRMVHKRLTSRFDANKWHNPASLAVWQQLKGSSNLAVEEGMFESYARDTAERKNLSQAEKKQWVTVGRELDQNHNAVLERLEKGLGKLNCFIKDELYPKSSTTLRLIVSPPLDVKIIFGAVFRPVEDYLYGESTPSGPNPLFKHHFKHLTADAVGWELQNMGLHEGQVFFETDYSAFESSQNVASLQAEYDLYKTYYPADSLGWKVLDAVFKANTRAHTVLHNRGFNVAVGPMRWSGMPNTACGNLIMNYFNLIGNCGLDDNDTFYCEGDDTIGIVDAARIDELKRGSAFPLELATSQRIDDLSFCGHHFIAGKRVPMDEGFAVAKLVTYFARPGSLLSLQKEYELMYLRTLSYQLLYPEWDKLYEIINIFEQHYKNRVVPSISKKTFDLWRRNNYWWVENRLTQELRFDHLPQPKGHLFINLRAVNISPAEYMRKTRTELERQCFGEKSDPGDPITMIIQLLSEYSLKLGAPLAGVLAAAGHPKAGAIMLALSGALKAIVDYALEDHGQDNFVIPMLHNLQGLKDFMRKLLGAITSLLAKEGPLDGNIIKPLMSLFDRACGKGKEAAQEAEEEYFFDKF